MSATGWPFGLMAEGVLFALGVLAGLAGLYLLVLALAALGYRVPRVGGASTKRLAVLVPAHDEEELIERCVASLQSQDYPRDLFRIVVIADNCTDRTAELARRAGAEVLIRCAPEARGKGQALRWAMDHVLARPDAPDAVVIVDADSVADRGLLAGLASHLDQGADVVQGEYLVLDELCSPGAQLRAAAFLLFHRVRFAGRSVLHLPCSLVGNGMLLSRRLVELHPWGAFTSAEDLEYSLALRLAGVRPVFAGSALVRAPVAMSARSAQVQRERWEGGRLHAQRTALPHLLREVVLRGRWELVDAVVDLLVPPLGLLTAGSLGGMGLALALWAGSVASFWLLVPWLVALAAIAAFVLVGLRAGDAPRWMYRRLLSAPLFLVRKVLGLAGVVRSRGAETWIRTERPSEHAG